MNASLPATSSSVFAPSERLVAVREQAVRCGPRGRLVGIVTEPRSDAAGQRRPTAVFVTAGMLHRVGPNRLYVTLARRLAGLGVRSLRFDLSGIGDSLQRTDGVPADEGAVDDIRAAMDAMIASYGPSPFVAIGLCSGAVSAFRAALADERVRGAILVNPQGFDHNPAWNAHVVNQNDARRYVRRSLMSAESWRRALTGRIDYRRLVTVLQSRAGQMVSVPDTVAPIATRLRGEFVSLAQRGVEVLVVCSDGDASVDYMSAILARRVTRDIQEERFMLRLFSASDHSLTLSSSQRALLHLVESWIAETGSWR